MYEKYEKDEMSDKSMSDKSMSAQHAPAPAPHPHPHQAAASDSADGTHNSKCDASKNKPRDRMRRPSVPVVQTSIRMSRGTREALNLSLFTLNKHKPKDEPEWTLGEVIELAIRRGYPPWRLVRDHINQNPHLKAVPARKRRREQETSQSSAA